MIKILIILTTLIPSLSWGLTFKDGKQVDDQTSLKNNDELIKFNPIYKNENNEFSELLKDKKTINRFRPWFFHRSNPNSYGLSWGGHTDNWSKYSSYPVIGITELYWRYVYKNKSWSELPGIYDFTTDFNTKLNSKMLQTKRLPLDVTNEKYQDYLAKEAKLMIDSLNSKGVLLDWWHNKHNRFGNETASMIEKARIDIAEKLKRNLGKGKLIMANINWEEGGFATHHILNGAYLELYKDGNTYSSTQLFQIEKILISQNQKLQIPKIIAAEFWKVKSDKGEKINLKHPLNHQYAKLFTAMVSVIPDNGYITYIWGNGEKGDGYVKKEDYDYDFYNFDIGLPISSFTQVSKGIGIKEFERGIIAYNINNNEKKITLSQGNLSIPPKSGLMCEYQINTDFKCLNH